MATPNVESGEHLVPGDASPQLLGKEEMAWGPAPDAFPAGCEFCLLHGDPGATGETFTVRLRVAQRYVFAPHSHPHDEHVTIISGHMKLGNGPRIERDEARTLGPGDYAFLPKEQFHYAWAEDDVVFQVQATGPFGITYANPADDPRSAAMKH